MFNVAREARYTVQQVPVEHIHKAVGYLSRLLLPSASMIWVPTCLSVPVYRDQSAGSIPGFLLVAYVLLKSTPDLWL